MARTIYCEKCGRRVASHDGRSTNVIVVDCKKCNKRVVFNPATLETVMKEIPPRNTSSGMTFR